MKTYVRQIASFEKGMITSVDDNKLPMSAAKYTYNFDTDRGALVDGIGLSDLTLGDQIPVAPSNAVAVWQYTRSDAAGGRDDRLVLYGEDQCLYTLPLYGEREWSLLDATFLTLPTAINYRLNSEDVLILCSGTDGMAVYNGDTVRLISDSPDIVSMCVHYERLWAIASGDRDCVWFSSNLDPTGWNLSLTGAGFISMPDERGDMLKVLSFHDYIYVFREYGITRISAYADQTQFTVSHLFTSSGAIFKDTVALCGDRILFAATDGLYVFDGLETTKILKHLTFKLNASDAKATFAEGKYYLSCRYDFLDGGGVVDALMVYDINDGHCAFFKGVKVTMLQRIASGAYHAVAAITGGSRIGMIDQSGKVFECPTVKVWATPYTDLGRPDLKKVLRSLTFFSTIPLTVYVLRDGVSDRYEVNGGQEPQRVRLYGKAKRLGFVFESTWTESYVSCPVLTYSV